MRKHSFIRGAGLMRRRFAAALLFFALVICAIFVSCKTTDKKDGPAIPKMEYESCCMGGAAGVGGVIVS